MTDTRTRGRYVHIALSMDPTSSSFLLRCESNPALYTRCDMLWMGSWSNAAMESIPPAVCLKGIDEEVLPAAMRPALAKQILALHRSCEEAARVTPRMYVSCCNIWRHVFLAQVHNNRAQQQHNSARRRRSASTTSPAASLSSLRRRPRSTGHALLLRRVVAARCCGALLWRPRSTGHALLLRRVVAARCYGALLWRPRSAGHTLLLRRVVVLTRGYCQHDTWHLCTGCRRWPTSSAQS